MTHLQSIIDQSLIEELIHERQVKIDQLNHIRKGNVKLLTDKGTVRWEYEKLVNKIPNRDTHISE